MVCYTTLDRNATRCYNDESKAMVLPTLPDEGVVSACHQQSIQPRCFGRARDHQQ